MAVLSAAGATALAVADPFRPGGAPDLALSQWKRLVDRMSHGSEGELAATPVPVTTTASIRARTRLPVAPLDSAVASRQWAEYTAVRAKRVVELQPWRRTTTAAIGTASDSGRVATLVNLNPAINTWYLLTVRTRDGETTYHLTNARPRTQDLVLDPTFPDGLLLVDEVGSVPCDLWSPDAALPLAVAATSRSPYVLLCEERLSLRRPTVGHKTSIERVTDFLRSNVWKGEAITVFVRRTFFADAFFDTASVVPDGAAEVTRTGGPEPARLQDGHDGDLLLTSELGIEVRGAARGRLAVGRWYEARWRPGTWVSVIRPDLISPEVLSSYPSLVAPLDEVERQALAYLIAFDLERYELGFTLGTDHPRVGWSERAPAAHRDPALPGPDGIDTIDPLIATGIVSPAVADRLAATFTGGFKRQHGAFSSGALAQANRGSHYGFVENGVVLSKLLPGLSTLVVLDDGQVDIRTWSAADDTLLAGVAFARQNGVPVLEREPAAGGTVPGQLVNRWGPGNWSGSQDGRVRALRAGACIVETPQARYLVYAYFSTATPSAMARVFQAYGCRDAMHLDMNALEHTYAAIYSVRGPEFAVEHLISGMSVLDLVKDGVTLPRFVGYADNRDFFYLLTRERGEG